MNFKQREIYFLTSCYSNKVSEEIVFKYFILKYIVDSSKKSEDNIKIREHINNDYGINIPLSLVDSCLRQLSDEYDSLEFDNDTLYIKKSLFSLENELAKFTARYDSNIETILNRFNIFLESNSIQKIKSLDIINSFNRINVYILDNISNTSDLNNFDKLDKLLLEFIYYSYKSNTDEELLICLNKMIYTVLVYVYFSSINYRNEKIYGKSYIIDTNILIYLLGINGKSRQIYVLELLEFVKKYNCSLILSVESLSELSNLISKEKNEEIQFFKHENAQLAYNIEHYPETAVKNILKDVNLIIDESSKSSNKLKLPDWDNLLFSLDRYKTEKKKNRMFMEDSIDHDINLIFLGELYKKVSSFYEIKYPLITADYILVNWFSKEIKSKFNSEMTGIISLDKIILLMWIEGETFNENQFMANTWSYVVENIPYFKAESSNSIFRFFEAEIAEENKNLEKEDWRSALLIIERSFKDPSSLNKASREKIIEAIQLFKNKKYEKLQKEKDSLENRLSSLESAIKDRINDTEKSKMDALTARVEFIQLQNSTKEAMEFKNKFENSPLRTFLHYLSEKYWIFEFLKYFIKY